MANVGHGTARQIIDSDGDVVTVTNNKLDVNATIQAGDLNVGNVDVVTSVHPAGLTGIVSYDAFDAPTTVDQLSDLGSIGAQTDCKEIIIQADHDNSTFIMIGGAGTSATSTLRGLKVHGGESIIFAYAETADIWIDAPSGSQKVNVTILK